MDNQLIDLNKTRYTHRDYDSIKEDLINAIPSLTQEWTNTEESDPGIVLVKLMAMFGDTLSYNIDKIALELYLNSVTQRKNCAKILSLLGYKMHWYRSARVIAHIRLLSTYDSSSFYLTPYKTQFHAGNLVYTVLKQSEATRDTSNINISKSLDSSNTTAVSLIEGIAQEDTFTKSSLIENRYYFPVTNVDESEILLRINGAQSTTLTCELVDSLYLYTSNEKIYYEFNVDEYDKPYIQLSELWEDIAGTDTAVFTITYIKSSGAFGNVSSNAFTRISRSSDDSASAYCTITNLVNTTQYGNDNQSVDTQNSAGSHPETVDSARRNAANYIFTHNTLVTPTDFEKACLRKEGITLAKLVDSQIVLNDDLNLDELKSRANDDLFETVFLDQVIPGTDKTEVIEKLKGYLAILYLAYANFEYNNNKYYTDTFWSSSRFGLKYNITDTDEDPYDKFYWSQPEVFIKNPSDTYVISKPPFPNNENEFTVYGYKKTTDDIWQEGTTYYKYYSNYNRFIRYIHKETDAAPNLLDLYETTKLNSITFDKATNSITVSNAESYSYIEFRREFGKSPGYYPYKPTDNIITAVDEDLYNYQIMNTKLDYGTIKLFPFQVKGTLHLIERLSPQETLQVVDTVNSALLSEYYPSRHNVGEKPDFINLVETIQNADSKIKYFDAIGNIVEWAPEVRIRSNDIEPVYEKFFGDGIEEYQESKDTEIQENKKYYYFDGTRYQEITSTTGSPKELHWLEKYVSGNTKFTLLNGSPSKVIVLINGKPVTNYTYENLTSPIITFTEAPLRGDIIEISNGNYQTYYDKIFDSTSAIMYNGLKENISECDYLLNEEDTVNSIFNIDKKYLKFRFRNIEVVLDNEEALQNQAAFSEEGIIDLPSDYGTAYLVNYSKAAGLSRIMTITQGDNRVIQINNIPELRALCQDITYKGYASIKYIRSIINTIEKKYYLDTISTTYSSNELVNNTYTTLTYKTPDIIDNTPIIEYPINPEISTAIHSIKYHGVLRYIVLTNKVTYEETVYKINTNTNINTIMQAVLGEEEFNEIRYYQKDTDDTFTLVTPVTLGLYEEDGQPTQDTNFKHKKYYSNGQGTETTPYSLGLYTTYQELNIADITFLNNKLLDTTEYTFNFLFDTRYSWTGTSYDPSSIQYYVYNSETNSYSAVGSPKEEDWQKGLYYQIMDSGDDTRALLIQQNLVEDTIDTGRSLIEGESYVEIDTLINNTGLQYLKEL